MSGSLKDEWTTSVNKFIIIVINNHLGNDQTPHLWWSDSWHIDCERIGCFLSVVRTAWPLGRLHCKRISWFILFLSISKRIYDQTYDFLLERSPRKKGRSFDTICFSPMCEKKQRVISDHIKNNITTVVASAYVLHVLLQYAGSSINSEDVALALSRRSPFAHELNGLLFHGLGREDLLVQTIQVCVERECIKGPRSGWRLLSLVDRAACRWVYAGAVERKTLLLSTRPSSEYTMRESIIKKKNN